MKIKNLNQPLLKEGNIFNVKKEGNTLHFYSKTTPWPSKSRYEKYTYNELIYSDKKWELKENISGKNLKEVERENDSAKFQDLLNEGHEEASKKNMFLLGIAETIQTRGNDAIVLYKTTSKRPYCYGYIRDMSIVLSVEPLKKKDRSDDICCFLLIDKGFIYSTYNGLLGVFDANEKKFSYTQSDLYFPRIFRVNDQIFVTGAGNKIYMVEDY